jgi:hypothetical protein
MTAVPLEREDRVDHVLEDAGPRNRAVLRDVADQQDRRAGRAREPGERCRAAAHLRHGSRLARRIGIAHGLDRVDHHHGEARCLLDHGGKVRAGRCTHAAGTRADAPSPAGHLLHGLLPADEQDLVARSLQPVGRLQRQGRLPDPRLAREEHDGPRDKPPAEHPVELPDPGAEART